MKYTVALAALAAMVSAQSIADLPTCSLTCIVTAATQIGCSATDFECSCTKAAELTPAVTPCVQKACPSAADQEKVISVLSGICASAGFPITIPKPSSAAPSSAAPSSAAPSSAAAPSEAKSSSVAPTVQTSMPAPSMASSAGYAMPSASSEESCVVVTHTVTKTGSSPAPYPTVPAGTGMPPAPSGTGHYSAPPPYFTGAASAVKVPAGIAGVLGLAAFIL